MAFQGIMSVRGQVHQLLEVDGSALVGTKIKAPLSVNPEVYVLPMDNVLPTKVSSVLWRMNDHSLLAVGNRRCNVRTVGFAG